MIIIRTLIYVVFMFGTVRAFSCMVISSEKIEKDLNFFGYKLDFIIENDVNNFIIEIQGPLRNYRVTQKKTNFGVWLDSEIYRINDIPSFYFIGYNKNKELAYDAYYALFKQIEKQIIKSKEKERFLKFFQQKKEKDMLFNIALLEDQRINLTIPANAPLGIYTATFYDASNVTKVYVCQKQFEIRRNDILEKIYDISKEYKILYSIFIIAAAISVSFFISKLFKK